MARPKYSRAYLFGIALLGNVLLGSTIAGIPVYATTSSAPRIPTTLTTPQACISPTEVQSWPLTKQAGQVVMVSMPIKVAKQGPPLVRRFGLAGLLVRGNPLKKDAPLIRAIGVAKVGVPTIVAVDEEGGRVQHLRNAIGPLPSAQALTILPLAEVRKKAAAHARSMRAMGFTMNFGPVLDLVGPAGKSNGIGDRAFSTDATVVAATGAAFADGMLDGGITPVVKHFPGHGNASGDTHDVGAYTPQWSVLRETDLTPFRTVLASRPRIGVMTGHLHVPGLTDRPASIAKSAVTGVLRDDFRFDGLVVSDSLSMWAVRARLTGSEVAVEALKAGNDLLLFDEEPNVEAIVNGLAAAAATSEEVRARLVTANLRVLRAAGANVCPANYLTTPVSVSTSSSSTSSIASATSASTATTVGG